MNTTKADPEDPLERLSSEQVQAFGLLLEGYQRLAANIEADLKADTGLSLSELEVLIHLANESDGQLRPRELADKSVMTTSGCTRLLDRLEEQQLLERHPHGSDRRGLVIELTTRGRRWLDSILPEHYESLEQHLWNAISDRELRQLGATMRKIRDANATQPLPG